MNASGARGAAIAIAAVLLVAGCGAGERDATRRATPSPPEEAVGSSIPGSGPARDGPCDRVAAANGDDAGPGTAAQPFRSAQRLVDALEPGQTGCLREGRSFESDDQVEIRTPQITLASYPGERATLVGRLYVVGGADDVTVRDLDLDQRSSYDTGPAVLADNTTFDNVDVSNGHTGICFVVGNHRYGKASGTLIANSRIHDCGRLPATNQDHGIYVAVSDGAVIRDNWIYDNADRGVQLYPDAQRTRVYGNVIYGNGEGIAISGDGSTASSDNRVFGNVIGGSRERWNVEADWPQGLVGEGNVVRANCLIASNPDPFYNSGGGIPPPGEGGNGFERADNRVARPAFVDSGASDFRLQPGSPCAALLHR